MLFPVTASEAAPSIIFMDEIDSIGGARSEGSKGGDSEVQRTMLELLNQLDGFEPAQNIKVRPALHTTELTFSSQVLMCTHRSDLLDLSSQVIMCTNRIDILDPALLRPGRIDRKIEFPNPAESVRVHQASRQTTACLLTLHVLYTLLQAREHILKIHSRRMNLMRGINLKKVASKMNSASGAECKVRHHTGTTLALHLLRFTHAHHTTTRAGCVHRGWHVCTA